MTIMIYTASNQCDMSITPLFTTAANHYQAQLNAVILPGKGQGAVPALQLHRTAYTY